MSAASIRPSLSTRHICLYSVIASIVFSLAVLHQHDLINNDGILYVLTAELLQNWQISDAFKLFNWPFLPLLISLLDKLTDIGLENSAYTLIILFDAAFIVAFILIVKELGGDTRTQIIAVLVVFSLAYFNENRGDITRDHGYWACYLFSILQYLKFYRSSSMWQGLGWSITMLLGALFRIEGFVIWTLLPLVIFLRNETSVADKFFFFLRSYVLHILVFILVSIYITTSDINVLLSTKVNNIISTIGYLLDGIGTDMNNRLTALKTGVLHNYSDDYAPSAIAAIFFLILTDKILTALTIPFAGLYCFASLRTIFHRLDIRLIKVLAWAAILNVLIISVYLSKYFFLSARWAIPTALTFLLFVPFMLGEAINNWRIFKGQRSRYMKITYMIFSLIIVYGLLDGLISTSRPKIHIKDAGTWIKHNIDKDSSLYANYEMVLYYSGRLQQFWKDGRNSLQLSNISDSKLLQFDYLAIKLDQTDTVTMDRLNNMADCFLEKKRLSSPRNPDIIIILARQTACDGLLK